MTLPDASEEERIDTNVATCLHCGLPLVRPSAQFCCYGCSISYELVGAHTHEERGSVLLLMRLGIAAFLAANVMVLTWASYGEQLPILFPVEDLPRQALHFLALILSVPVFALIGVPYLRNAWREIREHAIGVDTLIASGTASAFLVSLHATITGSNQVYFDTASMVLVLVTFGRYLESTARIRAASLLRELRQTTPQRARRFNNGREETVPVSELLEGDIIRVLPGEQIPIDGVVMEGETSVTETLLTGEPFPVARSVGGTVLGGSVNHDGCITIRATCSSGTTFFARLTALVQTRLSQRSKTQKMMDATASWFTPAVILVAVGTAVFGLLFAGISGQEALLRSLSVLLIACPCALGIGTSLSESIAFHRALHNGVLCKSLDTLEAAGRVRSVVFDKTGTVTTGRATVTHLSRSPASCLSEESICALAASLERHTDHPFGMAIVAFCERQSSSQEHAVSDVRVIPGKGIQGSTDIPGRGTVNVTICRAPDDGSSWNWVDPGTVSPGVSMALLLINEEVQGIFFLRDSLRGESREVLASLRSEGWETLLVSGDNPQAVERVASEISIQHWKGGVLPQEKATFIDLLGQDHAVAMVGDGINDAPALAAATCGVAFNSGPDLSRQAADVVVLGASLWAVPWLLDLGRKAARTIRWNIVWMLSYNVAGVGLAVAGVLHPVFAALAMVGSSGMIIANSSRLAHCRLCHEESTGPE